MTFEIRKVGSKFMNDYLTAVHYLHRPIIRSKLLAHGVYVDNKLVGGILWATPHFQKKRDLFGMPGTLDKWEVLMLARFYLAPDTTLIASDVLSDSIGNVGRKPKGSHRRGWRVQQDWCKVHPPVFPQNPFVPRLLISWSDLALPDVEHCAKCGQQHNGKHKGIIYQAANWSYHDTSKSGGTRTGRSHYRQDRKLDGEKRCYILRLGPNHLAYNIGLLGWYRSKRRVDSH